MLGQGVCDATRASHVSDGFKLKVTAATLAATIFDPEAVKPSVVWVVFFLGGGVPSLAGLSLRLEMTPLLLSEVILEFRTTKTDFSRVIFGKKTMLDSLVS
jgi:hypothetical protein